jgi:hypothetical protein
VQLALLVISHVPVPFLASTVAGKGHIDLVKPERADDAAVLILKNFLKTLVAVRPKPTQEARADGLTAAGADATAGIEAALAAQNQPVFEAKVQGVVNEEGVCDRDYIILKNAGAPISQVNVKRLSVFTVRYYNMRNPRNPPHSRTFVTHGYHNASFLTENAVGDIFRTEATRHRLRVHGLLNHMRKQFDGYTVLADFRHFLEISYNDRGEKRHTRMIELAETAGYKGVSEGEWKELLEANASSPHFDLDSMSDEQFLQIVREGLTA